MDHGFDRSWSSHSEGRGYRPGRERRQRRGPGHRLSTGITPEAIPPTLKSIVWDPSQGRFDIEFSKPMDRISVGLALSIEPGIAFQTAWGDDSNLIVLLQERSQPEVAYTLAIAKSAADIEGTTLTEAFVFGFTGFGATQDSGVIPDLWLRVSLLLTVGLMLALGLYLWSRGATRRLMRYPSRLGTRLKELDIRSRAEIFRELAALEGLLSESIVPDSAARHIPKIRQN